MGEAVGGGPLRGHGPKVPSKARKAVRAPGAHLRSAAFLCGLKPWLLTLLAVAGCARPGPEPLPQRAAALRSAPPESAPAPVGPRREGAGPFWQWQETPSGRLEWDLLDPFFAGWSQPGNRVTMVRPLFYVEDEGPGSTRWDFRALWPFVWARRQDESSRFHFFPIVWWDKRVDRAGGEPVSHSDWALMPILWGGADTARGGYFAVFPAGGLLKGKVGEKWIRFAAFPLWVDFENPHYHSWNLVWPVLGVWRGPDARGWRVWPFYGFDSRDGRYRRVFVLWPFGHHWRNALDTANPSETWVVFPFWLSYRNAKLRYQSVLWPFFGRKQSLVPDDPYVEWHAPWPFISWTRGESVHGFKLFPFYARRVGAAGESRQVLWPFYVSETVDEGPVRVSTVTSAFIFRYVHQEWVERSLDGKSTRSLPPRPPEREALAAKRRREPGTQPLLRKERPESAERLRSETHALLWPLFRYERNEHGERFFTTLEPWWFRKREPFDRLYGPFLTIYRYEDLPDGRVRDQALFHLYEHTRSRGERRVRLIPFFDYQRRGLPKDQRLRLPADYPRELAGESSKRFRVLGGLLGYERRGTAKRIRLLWVPIGRKPAGWDQYPAAPGAVDLDRKPPPASTGTKADRSGSPEGEPAK